jgi:hypothetical protein
MTDYQHVWGPVRSRWSLIDYRASQLLNLLTVWAWIGMISFFISVAIVLVARSNAANIAMLISLALWIGCGISVIRIRRARRKFLTIQL